MEYDAKSSGVQFVLFLIQLVINEEFWVHR